MTSCTAPGTHRTYSDYRRGCKHPEAREASRLYYKRRRENRALPNLIPVLGTARRIQALTANGYSAQDIADHTGLAKEQVQRIANQFYPRVRRSVAERVAKTFDQLALVPGDSWMSRARARRNGWPPPLAWGDDIDDPNAAPEGIPGQCVIWGCTNKGDRSGGRCRPCAKAGRTNDVEEVAA